MHFQRGYRSVLLLLIAAVAAWGSLYIPAAPHARAGFFSNMYQGIKDITQLPSEVNELKESYQQTRDKLEEANATLEAYRQQNEALLEQNRELAESVAALTKAEQDRENQSRKIRIMIITAVALIAGYFLVLRLIRVLLRR